VVTVGNFDGVHRGHQALIRRVVDAAHQLGAPACVLTFDPLPTEVFRPERVGRRLQRPADKLAALSALGVDQVVVEPFDRGYGAHDARWFAQEVLARRLGARAVVLGWDFRFGRDREGTPAALGAWLTAPVTQVEALLHEERPVSSTRIREALGTGDATTAAALLGRPYRIDGTVVHGDHRGRTIGFPTANLWIQGLLPPAVGVYAAWADAGDGPQPAVANFGVRPTFGGDPAPRLEVHLLSGGRDLYDAPLRVDLVAGLRGEQAFASREALIAQIHQDVAAARDHLQCP